MQFGNPLKIIPILIWLKIFKSVIQPIALYGSEVWGPLANQEFSNWDKHQIGILHTEFCKFILKVQRKTPNNAFRAELGQFPLLIDIQKRAISFYKHLQTPLQAVLLTKALVARELDCGCPLLLVCTYVYMCVYIGWVKCRE